MRLLEKKSISAQVANEKRHQVNEGVKIAQKVDVLREALASAEKQHADFLISSRKERQVITDELNRDIASKKEELRTLEDERIRLEAPLDLQEAWSKVKDTEECQKLTATELLDREMVVTSREASTLSTHQDLAKRKKALIKDEGKVNLAILDAEKLRKEANETLTTARLYKEKVEQELDERLLSVSKREEEVTLREKNVELQVSFISQKEEEIRKEKIHIASQQATLKTTWATIKKLQK